MSTPLFASLAETPVLDDSIVGRLQALQKTSGRTSVELFGELVSVFGSDGRERVAGLRTALTRDDSAGAARLAHAIKGAAANTGTARLAEAARRVEDALDGGVLSSDDIDVLARVLDEAHRALRHALLGTPLDGSSV
jgi:HPt (histidine-containing phosphotransfer) domain-containing protein